MKLLVFLDNKREVDCREIVRYYREEKIQDIEERILHPKWGVKYTECICTASANLVLQGFPL